MIKAMIESVARITAMHCKHRGEFRRVACTLHVALSKQQHEAATCRGASQGFRNSIEKVHRKDRRGQKDRRTEGPIDKRSRCTTRTGGRRDGRTEGRKDRRTEGQKDRRTEGQIDKRSRCTKGQEDGRTEGRKHRSTDRQIDKRTRRQTDTPRTTRETDNPRTGQVDQPQGPCREAPSCRAQEAAALPATVQPPSTR